jgi:hypothetical protein
VAMTWNPFIESYFLVFAVGYLTARRIYRRGTLPSHAPESIDHAEIVATYRAGRKVDALRLYRMRYGCDLKQGQAGLQALLHSTGNP